MKASLPGLMFAVVCLGLSAAVACEIRVRDSAFGSARDTHKLCLIAESADAQADAIFERLNAWRLAAGEALNVEVVRVDADDPETNWQALGMPSAPPRLPVTVLVGRNNGTAENFVIDHWQPEPDPAALRRIASSPLREALVAELTDKIAVLVYAPAHDAPAEDATLAQLTALVAQEIPAERIGLSLLTLDRDDPDEQLLCRFMGLRPESPATACVAFGRGKLMSPPLVGEQITQANLRQLVDQVRQACSCSQPLPTMGVDLPLLWTREAAARVVLMDQELDLATLESEVSEMLSSKASGDPPEGPLLMSIPQGGPPAVERTPLPTPSRFQGLASVAVLIAAAVLLSIVITRLRSSPGAG